MEKEELIKAEDFCTQHQVAVSFVQSLGQSGLIETVTIEENTFIPADAITALEKLTRLYYELDINLEGIEAVTYLLQRVKDMQEHITRLQNRLYLYESNG